MSIAFAGGGAAKALEEIIGEQMLRAQMAQRAQEAQAQQALERQRLAQNQQALEREGAFRESQQLRQDTRDILNDAAPGEISPDIAGILSKTPQGQARISTRKVLQGVRPVAGAMGQMDESGPQQINVLEPTRQQAEDKYRKGRASDISKILSGASSEKDRRAAAAQAFGEGIDVPNNLIGQTGAEKTAQELADEHRTNAEWERRNNITSAQADARQKRSDELMRGRADAARDDKPPTSAQSTLASYASRIEQAEPTLAKLEKSIAGMSAISFEMQMWADKPYAQSAEMQQYSQAAKNYINAVLRRESGAVISPAEFANARAQYLPTPGDTPDTLEMKRQNRLLNAATFKRGAGKAYQSVEDALKGEPLKDGATVNLPKRDDADAAAQALIDKFKKKP